MSRINEVICKTLEKCCESAVFHQYPESMKKLPCVSFYQSGNSILAEADDIIYAVKYVFNIDIWGDDLSETLKITERCAAELKAEGFAIEALSESYDAAANMKYRIITASIVS